MSDPQTAFVDALSKATDDYAMHKHLEPCQAMCRRLYDAIAPDIPFITFEVVFYHVVANLSAQLAKDDTITLPSGTTLVVALAVPNP